MTPHFFLDGTQQHGTWHDGGFTQSDCKEIGDRIWRDNDNNGVYNQGVDTPIQGAKVELWQEQIFLTPTYSRVDETDTNANGIYSFDCVSTAYRHTVVVRDLGSLGFLVPSEFYSPDPLDSKDDDNNFVTDPNIWPLPGGSSPLPVDALGATNLFRLDHDHTTPYYAIDGGFTCNADTIDLAVTIDTSGSMKAEIGPAKEAARVLIDKLFAGQGAQHNQVAVIPFNSVADVAYHLGSDKQAARTALASLDRDNSMKRGLAAWDENPADLADHKAFCMKVTIACWGGSQVVAPPVGKACFGPTPLCGGMCGAGRYHIPHEKEFELGARNYAAIFTPGGGINDYTKWPHPGIGSGL